MWGNFLEPAIAQCFARENGWKISRLEEYIRIPELRIGSSFDYIIEADADGDKALQEVKNVDGLIFRDEWQAGDDGYYEAPAHIELQAQHQMLVSGIVKCYITAYVGGNRSIKILRKPDGEIHQAIIKKANEFWESIDKGVQPEINYERDAEMLQKIYGFSEPGKIMQADDDDSLLAMANEYKQYADQARAFESKKAGIKAQILEKIQDAEKVIGSGYTITAGMVGPAMIEAYERKGFRQFRVNWPRKKKGNDNE